MVKITGPLNGLEAHGTLRQQITFRRHAKGAIVTRKPRQPKGMPAALRCNAALVKFIQWTAHHWGIIESPGWQTLANTWNLLKIQAYTRYQIARFRANRPFNNDPDYEYDNPPPSKPETWAEIIEGSTTPRIYSAGLQDFEYQSLYRSPDPYFSPTFETLIALYEPYNGTPPFEDQYNLHGTIYYRALSWYICGGPSEPSDAVSVELP